jgi:glucose uptake protein
MFQPESYALALTFMLVTMFAWGSWANTVKMAPRLPFQIIYWDYVAGLLAAALIWGFTLGSVHADPSAFLANLAAAQPRAIAYALAAGAVFNVANLLLVAAVDIAGLAVAFPVGIGLALIVGVFLNYVIAPQGQVLLLAAGVTLVVTAIVVDAVAYRRRGNAVGKDAGRGLKLAVACGILMGSFFPLETKASEGPGGLGPYAVALVFAIGVLLCSIPVNTLLMRKPLTGGSPVRFAQFGQGTLIDHGWGVLGGLIWGTGAIFSFVAAHAALVGPAIAYAIGQGATMISAAWGVFVWREFAGAPAAAQRLIAPMFVLFLVGLGLIAIAPLY